MPVFQSFKAVKPRRISRLVHPQLFLNLPRGAFVNVHLFRSFLGLAVACGLAASAAAQTASPIQCSKRPLGLPLAGKTCLSGSDVHSQSFDACKANFLPTITANLSEGKPFSGRGLNEVDPARIYFTSAYAPRVYFLHESACDDHALGVTIGPAAAPTSGPAAGTNYTIFPSVHSCKSTVCSSGSGVRSASEPLSPGDFVQLPKVDAGQQLAFFLMSQLDDHDQPAKIHYNCDSDDDDDEDDDDDDDDDDKDGCRHLVAFFPDDGKYVVFGFEDSPNCGDGDHNDVMFAVDIGAANAAALQTAAFLPR